MPEKKKLRISISLTGYREKGGVFEFKGEMKEIPYGKEKVTAQTSS